MLRNPIPRPALAAVALALLLVAPFHSPEAAVQGTSWFGDVSGKAKAAAKGVGGSGVKTPKDDPGDFALRFGPQSSPALAANEFEFVASGFPYTGAVLTVRGTYTSTPKGKVVLTPDLSAVKPGILRVAKDLCFYFSGLSAGQCDAILDALDMEIKSLKAKAKVSSKGLKFSAKAKALLRDGQGKTQAKASVAVKSQ